MHPYTDKPIPQSERDAVTIENQRVLIDQLEPEVRALRLRVQALEDDVRGRERRIRELEELVGREKLALQDEVKRLRRRLPHRGWSG